MKPIIKQKQTTKKKFFNWKTIWQYLRTFFKNDAVVQCSIVPRKKNNYQGAKYWWISIPIFIMSLGIAMIPTTVQASKQNGSTMFAGGNLEFDRALSDTLTYKDAEGEKAYTKVLGDLSNIVIENHKATWSSTEQVKPIVKNNGKIYYLGYHTGLANKGDTNDQGIKEEILVKDFEFFYVSGEHFNKNIEDYVNEYTFKFDATKPVDERVIADYDSATNRQARDCNYIAFGEKTFVVNAGKGLNDPIKGDYEHIKNGSFADYLLKGTSLEDAKTDNVKFTKKVMSNYKTWSDEMFLNNRANIIGVQAGISLGTNGGVTLLLGFIMWLLTRGKRNPNRYITCLETMNMAGWGSLFPAILAMILGFIFPSFGVMGYLIFFGFRSMWLAMKYLRPQRV